MAKFYKTVLVFFTFVEAFYCHRFRWRTSLIPNKTLDEILILNRRVKQNVTNELPKDIEQQKKKNTEGSLKKWNQEKQEKLKKDHARKGLNQLLKSFYWEITKTNGEDIESDSLRPIQRRLDRHLLRNFGFSKFQDDVLEASNEALSAELKALNTKDGKRTEQAPCSWSSS